MRSTITQWCYSSIDVLRGQSPLRLAGAAGICLALILTSACGGGGSGSGDPVDGPEIPENDNPGDGNDNPDDPNPGDGGNDNPDDPNPGDGGDDNPDDPNPGDGGNDNPDDPNPGDGGDDNPDDPNPGDGGNDNPDDPNPGDGGNDGFTPSAEAPKLDEWEQNMVEWGHNLGQFLSSNEDFKTRRKSVYYDAQRVFFQIADYRGREQPWYGYAQVAENLYKGYLEKHDFQLAGFWRFPHGIYIDYVRTGDAESYAYIEKVRDRPTFSDPLRSNADDWDQVVRAREIAYALQGQIVAEKAGYPRQEEELERFVALALGHIQIWTTGNYITSNEDWKRCKPFMAGLTASALIEYYERSVVLGDPDERILPAIRTLADWLWENMWVANVDGTRYGAFKYVQYADGRSSGPSGDLNMLVVPMYGWLYKETGEPRFVKRGDKIFAGGVELAWLGGGKQFNQSYRTSFNYLKYRSKGIAKYSD